MLLTMKAPANREKGQRTVRCNEAQANILRKVGWTEVEDSRGQTEQHIPIAPDVVDHYIEQMEVASGVVIEPKLVKPKRTYHRRVVNIESDGSVKYKVKPPKRRYRRRDMTAEE